jgi:hypothetical protein
MPLIRHALLALLVALAGCGRAATPAAAPAPEPRYVVLVTFDGVRTQEFFGGLDTLILAGTEREHGIRDVRGVRERWWRPTREERRRLLLPFFWDSLAPHGLVLGDKSLGSRVTIQNPHRFSAPGYLELLTGRYQPDVTSNDQVRYPHRTVLEAARSALGLPPEGVALFASWENFRWYGASEAGAVLVNAGSDSLPAAVATPRLRELVLLERRAQPVWHGSRLDAFTGALALEYLRARHPRLLHVSFNDTDDLSHIRRYEGVLTALTGLDAFLRELWETIDQDPVLRGRTTLLLTTDHGRGLTPADWSNHDSEVEGAQEIWFAAVGPGTRARGAGPGTSAEQAQVAATVLRCLGLPPSLLPGAAPPVPGVCEGY